MPPSAASEINSSSKKSSTEEHMSLVPSADELKPNMRHHRLNSFSSATSTEETFFSDDDSDDSDSECTDSIDGENEAQLSSMGISHEQMRTTSLDEEDESDEQHAEAPRFETLVDEDPEKAMSFSVNEEMVEVVPTDMVESVLPIWIKDWNQQRKEWTKLQKAIKLKRSHTHNDINHPFHLQIQPEQEYLTKSSDIRRNRSEPSNYSGNQTTSSAAGRKIRHHKYGSHPSQPFPHSRTPNPIVVKSSKKIGKKHARYALTAGMMLGIRESVGGALGVEAEIEIDRWEEWERCWEEEFLSEEGKDDETTSEGSMHGSSVSGANSSATPSKETRKAAAQCCTTLTQECQRVSKYKFPSHQFYLGSNTSKPLPHKYKFKVYAPLVFARIRSLFGVEKQPFLHSICGKFNFYEFASNARSGQFFFYSHDGRYMIKTLTHTESKFLREILPFYYRHLSRYPHTFLTRFYGMYRVCMPHLNNQRLHFIIMKSVFSTEKKIDRVWDLKGSKTGRKSKEGDSVGKDLDIMEEGKRLKFVKPGAKEAFLEQLRRDATFLARLGIMDYSLLLGMHSCKEDMEDVAEAPVKHLDTDDDEPLEEQEPCRSNTPFRRGVLKRAVTGGTPMTASDDGFKALEELDQQIALKPKSKKRAEATIKDKGGSLKNPKHDEVTIPSTSSTSNGSHISTQVFTASEQTSLQPNPITSRSDEGIEGGVQLGDGTVSIEEIYYCGIIDILQYYNARKIGETVMKQAAGNSSQDISCVDPESYGKRFVKFIANLVDE